MSEGKGMVGLTNFKLLLLVDADVCRTDRHADKGLYFVRLFWFWMVRFVDVVVERPIAKIVHIFWVLCILFALLCIWVIL